MIIHSDTLVTLSKDYTVDDITAMSDIKIHLLEILKHNLKMIMIKKLLFNVKGESREKE